MEPNVRYPAATVPSTSPLSVRTTAPPPPAGSATAGPTATGLTTTADATATASSTDPNDESRLIPNPLVPHRT
ncbi:hypothetical protein BBK82_37025 [Lentzea guizhouensis]|uniref:Uncharacterized protein n=1 Tax=Lentzea guizhouensis TaxID=1586287 RepID=A0A1B2HSV4_9PSEU|nr:hypothetical protein [Lentzea guizhouensis]ANZ40765.1 hypothetical protein BBK82_37025 [Lentzea guizhouensis]